MYIKGGHWRSKWCLGNLLNEHSFNILDGHIIVFFFLIQSNIVHLKFFSVAGLHWILHLGVVCFLRDKTSAVCGPYLQTYAVEEVD